MPAHEGLPNLFGLHQYDYKLSFFDNQPTLSQGVGYAVVVGFGFFFSVFTCLLVYIDYKYGGTKQSSEQFNCGGRTIKTGLIAVDIVSHWTWAATLLQSSNVAYKDGVSGPFWYAAGATVQILLFGILAIEVKRKAPTAHTVLEIIRARWGRTAHLTFMFFCLLTNVIVTAMLLLGGAAVMNALTGMSLYAAAMLIPISIIAYTVMGGLKATFLSSYLHTVIIYAALCTFAFVVYATSPDLGSPSRVYDNIKRVGEMFPVEGNKEGQYLTMFSKAGFVFGIINIIGNFGTVFVDQAYWQSAIAAKPSAAHRGYLLGGLLWFCIPFTLATTMGLAAIALDLPISVTEANAGLVPPAVAVHLLGSSGSVLLVTMLFMAVTSAGSAELVAVSSLFTYDVYVTYFRPKSSGHTIMRVSQVVIVVFGFVMGVLAIILQEIHIGLGYVYLLMGVLIGSAVVPIACCLMWRKTSKWGAIIGAFAGQWLGIIAWLAVAQATYGSVTVDSTGEDYPMLAGNLVAICSSALICITMSLIRPDNYDFVSMRQIAMVDDSVTGFDETGPDSVGAMDHAKYWILKWGGGLAFILVIAWPCLALPAGVFSKSYFYFWVIISIIWGLIASFVATFMPLWESRGALASITSHLATCTRTAAKEEHTANPTKGLPGNGSAHSSNPSYDPKLAPPKEDIELGKHGDPKV